MSERTDVVGGGTPGWWFARRPVARGEVQAWAGALMPGRSGLHAARSPLGALPYAKSGLLCRISLHGERVAVDDQLAGALRRIEYVVDARPVLRRLARRWIERLLGEPLRDRDAHIGAARAARERVIECEERIRDARWALEHGARQRTSRERATAEGRLEGANRASVEARREAAAHEAAAIFLEGDEIQQIARAVDRTVRAFATLAPGDVDRAMAAVRDRLDAELVAALEPFAPAEPLPPFEPSEEARERRPTPLSRVPPAPLPQRGPPPPAKAAPLAVSDGHNIVLERLPSARPSAEEESRDEPEVHWVTAAMPPVAPSPSAAELVDAIRGVLSADPAFVSLHRIPGERLTLLIRRARAAGSEAILDELSWDPLLATVAVTFVVCWDAPVDDRGPRWFVSDDTVPGRLAIRAEQVREARRTAAIDLDRVDLLPLELILAGVRSYSVLDLDPPVLVIDPTGADPGPVFAGTVFARAARAGASRVVIESPPPVLSAREPVRYQSEGVRLDTSPEELRRAWYESRLEAVDLSTARLGPAVERDEVPQGSRRAQLAAVLDTAPSDCEVYRLDAGRLGVSEREVRVLVVEAEADVDALAVHLARSLSRTLVSALFVVPENGLATALDRGTAGAVCAEPWEGPPLDDLSFVDAVFEALERPPEALPEPAVNEAARGLVGVVGELSSVAALGLVPRAAARRPVVAVRIIGAFSEARVRRALEAQAPELGFVFVTGASRLTPGLEAHVITPNERADEALRDVSVSALARALYDALVTDPFYRQRP